jgi:hypothetical protein
MSALNESFSIAVPPNSYQRIKELKNGTATE